MLVVLGAILLASAFICSALLCWAIRSAARRVRFVDRPGAGKIHSESVALGGGIALFLTTAGIVGAGVVFALIQRGDVMTWPPRVIQDHIPRILARASLVLYILAGGAVMFVLGFLDDVRQLSPWTRLAVQTLVAALLCVSSDELRVTAFVAHKGVSFIYTILWVVGITNAFNLLDNMDGLSAGVAAIASLLFIVVAVITQQYFLAAMLLVFLGALLGFLVFNFPPASLFMGDAGSMFIGYLLAMLTILFTFYVPNRGYNPFSALLVPVVILAVPIYDTISVVVIRLAQGKPIFGGDKNHFSHRLVALGMSKRAAVLTIYLVTLCTGLLAPLLLRLETAMSLLVFANVAMMLALIWLLEHVGRRGRNNQGNAN